MLLTSFRESKGAVSMDGVGLVYGGQNVQLRVVLVFSFCKREGEGEEKSWGINAWCLLHVQTRERQRIRLL